MSWQNVDLFELEATWFSEELHKVIRPLFEQGHEMLAKWDEDRKKSLREDLINAGDDESERQTASWLADLEDEHNRQRGQVLGAAALHYVYSTLKTRLRELARYFDKTHPRSPKGYQGKSDLDRMRNEYIQRFAVDFENSPFFEHITELALARNAGVHLGVDTMEEYIEKVERPRFCDGEEFYVSRAAFLEVLSEADQFFNWVVQALLPIRRAAAAGPRDSS